MPGHGRGWEFAASSLPSTQGQYRSHLGVARQSCVASSREHVLESRLALWPSRSSRCL